MDAPTIETLLADVRLARQRLPSQHVAILDALGVQEAVHTTWPDPVIDLYETIRLPRPQPARLAGAVALWLPSLRTIAVNGPALRAATAGLDEPSRRDTVAFIAWHEYGHALSAAFATPDRRRRGPQLLELAPPAIQQMVRAAPAYRPGDIFDETIAGVYALLVARIRDHGYGVPEYLDRSLFDEFKEIIPWPPRT